MPKFIAVGYAKDTSRRQESEACDYKQALHYALEMKDSDQYKVITILRDSEWEDHPDNAGKFFLHRIIK